MRKRRAVVSGLVRLLPAPGETGVRIHSNETPEFGRSSHLLASGGKTAAHPHHVQLHFWCERSEQTASERVPGTRYVRYVNDVNDVQDVNRSVSGSSVGEAHGLDVTRCPYEDPAGAASHEGYARPRQPPRTQVRSTAPFADVADAAGLSSLIAPLTFPPGRDPTYVVSVVRRRSVARSATTATSITVNDVKPQQPRASQHQLHISRHCRSRRLFVLAGSAPSSKRQRKIGRSTTAC
jgi:hypothetical protein